MKKITELVTSPEKPEQRAKRKAITFGSFKRAEDKQVAERKQREHDAELAVITEEARIQRVLEEEEQKAVKEENRRRREKFITKSLSNAFGTKNEVDMTPVREQVIDRYLPKTALPEAEEYPTPFKDEPALNAELAEFKKKINEHLHTIGFASSGGGGIGSIADANDLVDGIGDGEFLQFRASDGKFIGATASVTTLALSKLDIDGGTDIGEALVDADLLVVDNGAGGTNRKTEVSRIKTYVADVTLTTAAQTNITSLGTLTTLTVDSIIINGTNIGHTSDTDAIAIGSGGVVNFSQSPTVASAAVKFAGKESIWVPAGAMYPSSTNGCADLTQVETTALRPDLKCLDFDASSDEFAQFSVAFPKSWNEGTVTFQPFWTVTGTNTGTVAWQLGGIAASSDDSINTAFGTLVATTALAHSGTSNDLMVSVESGNVTIAGSPAAGDCCFFQINRDISADNQSGDARLLGVKLFFTTDAANDA